MMCETIEQIGIEEALTDLFGRRRPTLWVTRERPKIDRIACPWLVRRFIDPAASFLYVPAAEVLDVAEAQKAVAFDIPGAPFSHVGERCSFDAFLARFGLEEEEGLKILAPIVRGADTDRHGLAAEAAGLHAISLGLAHGIEDDHALLDNGMLVYDALYAWAVHARRVRHSWQPGA